MVVTQVQFTEAMKEINESYANLWDKVKSLEEEVAKLKAEGAKPTRAKAKEAAA